MTDLERKHSASPVPKDWTYAPAPESRDIVAIEDRYQLFIGGEWVEPRSGEYFATIDPSSEEPLAEIAQAGAEDVALAVDTARGALDDGWSAISPSERAKYLFRIARILQERSRELAVLESLNGGKPIREARDVDLPLAAAHFFYYAGWADKLEYAFPNRRPRPVGVAGQIIPWNFPLLMLAWKVAPALAAGNTVVLKPAETTSLTALLFCDVLRQAEVPPGVVNIVTGDGRAGAEIVKHPGVDKIAFTGSTQVGKAIQRELAGTDKRLTLELGGKAANIIFDDAALDQAIEGIINGIYF
ncbi:MAG: aldehyde dehydrogenase family protein, partial [Actinobacteria bacterium]|nr:aldehyde dehydrogenase family protein [Actinomycetota bacterium]